MLLSSIYNFKDYRQFLRAFYNFQKAQDASYSFKKFSLKAKIGSPNLLKLVMDDDNNTPCLFAIIREGVDFNS